MPNKVLKILETVKYQKYLAHISDNDSENLFEHTKLVYDYFNKIIKAHGLRDIVENLILDFVVRNYATENINSIKEYISGLFYGVPIYHDIGKINPNFQFYKMDNRAFAKYGDVLGSDHSKIGSFIFIQNYIKKANLERYSGREKIINLFLLLVFSFSINKHHSVKIEYYNEYDFSDDFISDIFKIFPTNDFFFFSKETAINIGKKFNKDVLPDINYCESFSLFALLKLNYSLLTASDYYATTHYMNGWKDIANDFGTFNDDLKKKIIKNVETTKLYNKKTYEELNSYKFEFPEETNNRNLNRLRQNLSVEIIKKTRCNLDKNLFYIEVPTGGGKTNLSILVLAELLKNDIKNGLSNITKIFYVFPFTTLITQTFTVLKDTLGLEDNEIVQIHSKTGFSQKGSDDDYGNKKENVIDYQFVNYPIALISHVKFFNILKSNKKIPNYLLHRLANSVVIIDELQTYPPEEWDKVIYFINEYAKTFNIKFILMSATLPKIDRLLSREAENVDFKKEEFILLNQQKERYFMNPNFKNRVEFDFNMLQDDDFNKKNIKRENLLLNLWNKILQESEKYKNKSKFKTVHTIIEFIYKQTVSEFIEIANSEKDFFDEIFILSGTILEPRRKEIVAKLQNVEYRSKNILLITTQVIEAGVDIDMDIGFKDSSLIDSDEQLAGRINRNFNKAKCKLFIFDLDDAKVIYGNDDRYKKIKNEFKSEYYNILKEKNFDTIYNSLMEDRNRINKLPDFINLQEYLHKIGKLNFESVDNDFKIINDDCRNVSIFVSIDIQIKIPNSENSNFTEDELAFLIEKGKHLKENMFVSGEDIWDLYCDIIQNKDEDFTKQKVQRIIMQGLMAKFSFSIGIYSKNFKFLSAWSCEEEKYGFFKLNDVGKFYDYCFGIKTLDFKDTNFF